MLVIFKQNSTSSLFKDWRMLNTDQKILVKDFIKDFLFNKYLCGKNKPNNLNDDGSVISGTELYEKNNLYHYHIGYKSYNTLPLNFNCNHLLYSKLQINMNGNTSAGVIHYIKFDDEGIAILSFGEEHKPFPNCNSTNNLLIQRATSDFSSLSALK